AALFCDFMLPVATTNASIKADVFATLRSQWRRHGVKFPKSCEVVLCHEVSLSQHYCGTTHCGVLYHHGKTFTYIEKAGGKGPFVRLDFRDRGDLLTWLSGIFFNSRDAYKDVFVTFNDKVIEALAELKKS